MPETDQTTGRPRRPAWREAGLLLLLVLPALFAYGNSLRGQFVFDDSRIYNSRAMRIHSLSPRALLGVVRHARPANRPVANLSFALNYYFNGYDTFGYHLVNLAVHLGCGILIFFIFRLVLNLARPGPGGHGHPVAWAAAAIWLAHPLNSQAVSYTVQRMAVLSAFFSLAALLCYLKARTAPGRVHLYALGVLMWVLALGSKENSAVLPVLVLACEWIFFQQGDTAWLKRAAPFIGGGVLAVGVLFLVYTGFQPLRYLEAGFSGRPFTMGQRLLTESRVLVYYLGLFLWPHPSRLSLEHDFTVSRSLLSPPGTLAAVVLLAALLAAALRLRKQAPIFAIAVLWFLASHLVESTIIPLDLVYEHRNYLADVFLCLLAATAADSLLRPRWLKAAAAAAVITLLAVATHGRNRVWHSRLALWRDCAQKAPRSARVHNNFGVALKAAGRMNEAAEQYRETIRLDPGFTEAYFNLGNILSAQGKYLQAIPYYRRAAQLAPRLAVTHRALGEACMNAGYLAAARNELSQALALDPGDYQTMADLRFIAAMERRRGPAPQARP